MARTHEILDRCTDLASAAFPPEGGACSAGDAAFYLAHTGEGESIRALARAAGTHPSTVLRAVRRVEERRDDPLIDTAFDALGSPPANTAAAPAPRHGEDAVRRAGLRFLRRMNEPGSFLVVAADAQLGGIFCSANEHRKPIAMVPVAMAAEFVKRDWIRLARRSPRSTRYELGEVGRAWLRRAVTEQAVRRQADGPNPGFAEAASAFQAQHRLEGERLFADPITGEATARKVNLGETPLGWLARRKGPGGKPFLAPMEYEAGEKLRTDFEAAQMGPSVAQDWRRFLTPSDRYSGTPVPRGPGEGPAAARARVAAALDALGPGAGGRGTSGVLFSRGDRGHRAAHGLERALGQGGAEDRAATPGAVSRAGLNRPRNAAPRRSRFAAVDVAAHHKGCYLRCNAPSGGPCHDHV